MTTYQERDRNYIPNNAVNLIIRMTSHITSSKTNDQECASNDNLQIT